MSQEDILSDLLSQGLQGDQAVELLLQALAAQTKATCEAEEKIRILRHDMRHLIAAVDASLGAGAWEEARRGLSTFQENMEKAKNIRYCENQVINATLVTYRERAEKSGVSFEVWLAPLPGGKVETTAFAVMLSNALENAFCAVESLPAKERTVSLKSRIFNGQYVLELANPCTTPVAFDKGGLPLSTQGEGHGLGTRSILAFAQENDAVVTFHQADSRFVMHMVFSLDV